MKTLFVGLTVLLAGCSAIDADLINALAKDNASFCAQADTRGGAGALAMAAPGGGYGQATLSFCRSNRPNARISLTADGSISIEHGAE